LAASLASSLVLYFLICVIMGMGGGAPLQVGPHAAPTWPAALLASYRAFLQIFWMTAPLAWIYAVPVEKWTSRLQAVKTRLWMLATVAAWRMALMMRALVVLVDCSPWAAIFVVMLFGTIVALVAQFVWQPRDQEAAPNILTGMGSIGPRGPHEDELLKTVMQALLPLGCVTLPIWFIGTTVVAGSAAAWNSLPPVNASAGPVPQDLWYLATGAVLAGVCLLPQSQRKVRRAAHVENLFAKEEFAALLQEMSVCRPADFPDHWQPPPAGRLAGQSGARLLAVLEELDRTQPAPWVRAAYLAELRAYVDEAMWYWFDDATFARLARLLETLPEGSEPARRAVQAINILIERQGEISDFVSAIPRDENQESTEPPPQLHGLPPGATVWSDPEWPLETPARVAALDTIRKRAENFR
jgi:hypothetical protein